MSIPLVVQIGREVLYTALLLALPTLVASLVVGLVVSILQAVTSIQEHTLSYAPRIVAVFVVMALSLPWSLQVITRFTFRMLWHAAEVGH